jgi:hypothetical protein
MPFAHKAQLEAYVLASQCLGSDRLVVANIRHGYAYQRCALFCAGDSQIFVKWATTPSSAKALRQESGHLAALAGQLPDGSPERLASTRRALAIASIPDARPVYFTADKLEAMRERLGELAKAPLELGGKSSLIKLLPLVSEQVELAAPGVLNGVLQGYLFDAVRERLAVKGSRDLVLAHADAHQENWVESGGKVILVDFNHVSVAPRYWDLAWAACQLKGPLADRVAFATDAVGENRALSVARHVLACMVGGAFCEHRRYAKYCLRRLGDIAVYCAALGDESALEYAAAIETEARRKLAELRALVTPRVADSLVVAGDDNRVGQGVLAENYTVGQ